MKVDQINHQADPDDNERNQAGWRKWCVVDQQSEKEGTKGRDKLHQSDAGKRNQTRADRKEKEGNGCYDCGADNENMAEKVDLAEGTVSSQVDQIGRAHV